MPTTTTAPTTAGAQVARGLVLAGAGFLLLSMGGAIFAAPAVLPLLAWTARRTPSRRLQVVAAVLAALTVAEVAWAGVYVTAGENSPWIVIVPLIAAIATAATMLRWARR